MQEKKTQEEGKSKNHLDVKNIQKLKRYKSKNRNTEQEKH